MARPRIDQYPNSTQEHRAAPLDIAQPLAATVQAVDNVTPVTVDLTGYEVLTFIAEGDGVWLEFSDVATTLPPTPGTLLPNTYFLSDGEVATLSLFGASQVHMLSVTGACSVYINALGRWIALQTDLQMTNV